MTHVTKTAWDIDPTILKGARETHLTPLTQAAQVTHLNPVAQVGQVTHVTPLTQVAQATQAIQLAEKGGPTHPDQHGKSIPILKGMRIDLPV